MTYEEFAKLNTEIRHFIRDNEKQDKTIAPKKFLKIEKVSFDKNMCLLSNGKTVKIPEIVKMVETKSDCISNPSILMNWKGFSDKATAGRDAQIAKIKEGSKKTGRDAQIDKLKENLQELIIKEQGIYFPKNTFSNLVNFKYLPKSENIIFNAYVYTKLVAKSDKYIAVGVHSCNPGCYLYLDKLFVYERKSKKYATINIYSLFENSHGYNEGCKLVDIRIDKDKIYVTSQSGMKGVVYANIVFKEDLKPNTTIKPILDTTKMETCFDYEILEDMSVLMVLKEEVPLSKLLRWPGFTMNYDAFKFTGSFISYGQAYLLFANTKTGKSWQVSYGSSTTMTDNTTWMVRDTLINCMKKVIPTHPELKNYAIMDKI